jgi:hypothetical protein
VDPIGAFIANLHHLLGHDKAAQIIGVPAGDQASCLLCQYEALPTQQARQAVIDAIGTGE